MQSVNRQIIKRRSTRVALSTLVGLSGKDRHKCSFTLRAKAVCLNQHGAAVQIHRELEIGSTILVRNKGGAQIPARVVAQVATSHNVPTYGIAFISQDDAVSNFWGITFPSNEQK